MEDFLNVFWVLTVLLCLRLMFCCRSSVCLYVHGVSWGASFTLHLSNEDCCFVGDPQTSASIDLFSWVGHFTEVSSSTGLETWATASILCACVAKALRSSPCSHLLPPSFWKITFLLTCALGSFCDLSRRAEFHFVWAEERRFVVWLTSWEKSSRCQS